MRSKSKFESWRKGEQFSDPNSPAVVLHILSTLRQRRLYESLGVNNILDRNFVSSTRWRAVISCPTRPCLCHAFMCCEHNRRSACINVPCRVHCSKRKVRASQRPSQAGTEMRRLIVSSTRSCTSVSGNSKSDRTANSRRTAQRTKKWRRARAELISRLG